MSYRTKLVSTFLAAVVGVTGLALPASAHPSGSFTACVAYKQVGGYCGETATYTPWAPDTVFLRGRVPSHGGATASVLRKGPGTTWKKVDSVEVKGSGVVRWGWRLEESDVNYNGPYSLRFKIPSHGKSEVVEAWVIYGE